MEKRIPAHPHDAIFKFLFSTSAVVQSFIRYYLCPAERSLFCSGTLEAVKDSHIIPELREHFTDILYVSKSMDRQKGHTYLLFEHKSFEDRAIGSQLLENTAMALMYHRRQHPDDHQPPVIVAVGLTHSLSHTNLPDEPLCTISLFRDYRELLPDIRFVFVNLNKTPDKHMRGIAKLKMLFLLLKYVRTPGLIKIMPRVIELYREQQYEEDALECFEAMLRYLVSAVPDEIDSIVSILREGHMDEESEYRRVLEMLMPDVVESAKRELRKELEQKTREEVGKTREEVGKAREEVGKAREEVGKAREEVGKAREEAGKARKESEKLRISVAKAKTEEIARNLIYHGMDDETISSVTGLEQETVKELRKWVS